MKKRIIKFASFKKSLGNKLCESKLSKAGNSYNKFAPFLTNGRVSAESLYRESPVKIQMLSRPLFNKIFRSEKNSEPVSSGLIKKSISHLKCFGLFEKQPSILPDIDLSLQFLDEIDIDKFFHAIGEEQGSPYRRIVNKFIEVGIPEKPEQWSFTQGWVQYSSDGSSTRVDYPDCNCLVFDVEVCIKEGSNPILATAVSDSHWYSWCSRSLIDQSYIMNTISASDLIPVEKSGKLENCTSHKVIIGHNVGYDRLRIREQYNLHKSLLRFIDTMSLHIAVSGFIHEQRMLMQKNKTLTKKVFLPWMLVGCLNNLNDVFKFYTKTKTDLKKSDRDIFVRGSLSDIRGNFQDLMSYCANDVCATFQVLKKLFPLFLKRFPHPVTFAGMLEMGTTYLPVTQNWNKYIELSEKEFHSVEKLMNDTLLKQALDALKLVENNKYLEDVWLWDLDWDFPKSKVRTLQNYPNWYRKLCFQTGGRERIPEPQNMSTGLHIVPKLLRMTWQGYPLHYNAQYGWGYLVPIFRDTSFLSESDSLSSKFPVRQLYNLCKGLKIVAPDAVNSQCSQEEADEEWENFICHNYTKKKSNSNNKTSSVTNDGFNIGIPGVAFFMLPHKNGPDNRVGNPLAKDFLRNIQDKTLSSNIKDIAELVLKASISVSYWKNNRDRILSQMVIWDEKDDLSYDSTSVESGCTKKCGAILPQVVVSGTVTRRGVERTWMTASNAYPDRIGSELKALIEAPPGWNFVGADVDSQELWIAAVLGDAYFSGLHGSSALGWMTLQGKKADGTDMHSVTAKTASITREQAKVINYGRIYGAGMTFIQRLLQQFNPSLDESTTKKRASDLLSSTKGKKGWYLNSYGKKLAATYLKSSRDDPVLRKDINTLIKCASKENIDIVAEDIVLSKKVWVGGSESHTFNCLEDIATQEHPKTPVLGASITATLEPEVAENQFMTSRLNWVVQSSAVDYLHLMLVLMQWLFSKYQISGRFSISIHDEVRYLVSSEDKYRAALALQITNLLTRSYFSFKLGLNDLPQSVAFFSSVDIDKVLRKEPHLDCVTPSNPEGLEKVYQIPKGESLDILKIIEKTSGTLDKR